MSRSVFVKPALLAAACLLSALTGYVLSPRGAPGILIPPSGAEAGSAPPSSTTSIVEGAGRPGGIHQQRDAGALAALKEQITRSYSSNPNPYTDFILRSQTAALLATMSADELQVFLAESSDGSANIGAYEYGWKAVLSREILRQWGLKDPAAASIAETSQRAGAEVFRDWVRRDRGAAEKWLMDTDGPDAAARLKILQSHIREQGRGDPSAASALLEKLDPSARESVLRTWSGSLANDPDGRAKLLAMIDSTGDEALREKCYGDIITGMARRSPEQAGNFLESSTLPEEAKNRMMDRLIGSWAQRNPAEAFRWWAGLNETEPRESLISPLKEWYFKDRDEPIRWLDGLPSGPARTKYEETVITNMMNLDDFPRAAKVAANIADDEARIRQMKIIRRTWEEQSKDYAAKWLGGLPEKDRKAVME